MSSDNNNDQNNNMNQGMPPYGYPYYQGQPQMPQQPMYQYAMPPQPMWPQHPFMGQCNPYWPPMYANQQMNYPMPQHHHNPMHECFDWSAQAQGMVEGMMNEQQAGVFKNIINALGVDDKEFWKGAMIGAAAALILSNDNVRNTLMQSLSGAGDMLKTAGSKIKDGVSNTASTVKDKATTSSEILRDTVHAGKEGFRESVSRHSDVTGREGLADE